MKTLAKKPQKNMKNNLTTKNVDVGTLECQKILKF